MQRRSEEEFDRLIDRSIELVSNAIHIAVRHLLRRERGRRRRLHGNIPQPIPRCISIPISMNATTFSTSALYVPFLDLSTSDGPLPKSTTSSVLISKSDFDRTYGYFQALHLRGVSPSLSSQKQQQDKRFGADDVRSLFASLNNQDKKSWCIENNNDSGSNTNNIIAPDTFLDTKDTSQRGYCSFLLQHSSGVKNNLVSELLPMAHLPVSNDSSYNSNSDQRPTRQKDDILNVQYGPCIWLFFGKNYRSEDKTILSGRPEHTDSVTHDGTWHYQLSGTKIWRLRPTTELLQRMSENEFNPIENSMAGKKRKLELTGQCGNEDEITPKPSYIEVECKQGDVIVINTRLWWHSTFIPPQDVPSVSYARDFYFKGQDEKHANEDVVCNESQPAMDNVDGTYAAEDIAADTILFTEHTMPDCELHRSKMNPNCKVVELEDEEGGECYMAVVSLRDIKAGEFFSIMESDEEADGYSEEENDIDCDGSHHEEEEEADE